MTAVPLLLVTGCGGASSEAPTAGNQPTFTVAASGADRTKTAPPSADSSSPPTPSTLATPSNGDDAAEPDPAPSSAEPSPAAQKPPVFERSLPTTLAMPIHGVQSGLLYVGLQPDGTLEVPPGHPGAPAAWYRNSPTPGEPGPSIFLGHVNADDGGPGVFAWIKQLVPGDTIEVAREDGTVATFTVERGEQYSKNAFPTLAVYGNTPGPELRLITCDGYDPASGTFNDNYVIYAKLQT